MHGPLHVKWSNKTETSCHNKILIFMHCCCVSTVILNILFQFLNSNTTGCPRLQVIFITYWIGCVCVCVCVSVGSALLGLEARQHVQLGVPF